MSNKLLVDVDTGTDDALALIMALSHPGTEVLAVTCVHGNVDVEQVCNNTMRVMHLCKKLDIPVYKGSAQPLLGERIQSSHHGRNGLGDAHLDDTLDLSLGNVEHAANAIVKWVNAYPGEVTLVALAPLTNIAVACQLDPMLGSKLKQCVIMGGNIYARGRVSPCAEFNFFTDAEAANIVLDKLDCSIIQIPYEIAKRQRFRLKWFQDLVNQDKPKARFIKAILENVSWKNLEGEFYCCDACAMTVALDSTVVKESVHKYCTVELHGQITRGQMIVDWNGITQKKPNVEVIMRINMPKVEKMFENMIE